MKIIEVSSYNPQWPMMYEAEAKLIREVLRENCVDVQHIGSTSVKELSAKPKIDILAVIKDRTDCIPKMESIGYEYRGEFNIPFQLGFRKRIGRQVNLHIFEEGNPEIELNILFRDYLRTHREACQEYSDLKLQLVQLKSSHEKNHAQFTGYNLGKDAFIKKIIEKTGFNGLCMRFCTHHDEWEAARSFRQKYLDNSAIVDPDTWTFNHKDKDQVHLVLYQGIYIIGYAHISLGPDHHAILRIIVIDEPYRHQGFEEKFLALIERWLNPKGSDADIL